MAKQLKNIHHPFLLVNPPAEILIAHAIIEKFQQTNNIKFKFDLTIKLDFTIDENVSGFYLFKDDEFSIYIDPQNCNSATEIYFGTNNAELSNHGYIADMSMLGVTLHEFCHFLVWQVFKTLRADYIEQFPTERLFLTHYASTDIEEELVEIMRLYLTNPLFLKLINPGVFKFLKKYFKSPYPCSNKHSYEFYSDFPKEVKADLKSKWGIVYNVKLNKFQRNVK
jgi:hypothetical protein